MALGGGMGPDLREDGPMTDKSNNNGSPESITISDAGRPLALVRTELDGVVVYTTTVDETAALQRRYDRQTSDTKKPSNSGVKVAALSR